MMMTRCIATLAALILGTASVANAATIVQFSGATNGDLATGTGSITLDGSGTFISGTLTNTSPFDARLTGFGFDIGAGNLNGYTGSITAPAGTGFSFSDGDLGNVPQFDTTDLDFGYITGPNFAGGDPNSGLDNFATLSFIVNGSFSGLTEEEIASSLFVRFQRVGENGTLSDVSTPDSGLPLTPVPEPASMMLLGSGLAILARRRYKAQRAAEGL